MQVPTIKQLVVNPGPVKFLRIKDSELWYGAPWVDSNGMTQVFQFPIPVDDLGGAALEAEDKPVRFMRWMRMHVNVISPLVNSECK